MIELQDKIILIILYVILGLCSCIITAKRIKEIGKIDLFSYFNLFFLLILIITPICVLIGNTIETSKIQYPRDTFIYYMSYAYTVLFYTIINFLKKILENKCVKKSIPTNQPTISKKNIQIITIIICAIGFTAMILWTKAYGSPFGILQYSDLIRSGINPIVNPLTFMKPLCFFSIIALFMSVSLLKDKKNIPLNIIITLLSSFSSIILVLGADSRMSMVEIPLTIIMWLINRKLKINLKTISKIIIIGIFGALFIGNIDNITSLYKKGQETNKKDSSTNISQIFASEFGHTYLSLNRRMEKIFYENKISSSEPQDLLNLAFAWIPNRISGQFVYNLYRRNSDELNVRYTIPTDILTATLYKSASIGVILMPLFIIILINYLEKILTQYKNESFKILYNYVGVAGMLIIVGYYDLYSLLNRSLAIVVTFFCIQFITKLTTKEKNERKIKASN